MHNIIYPGRFTQVAALADPVDPLYSSVKVLVHFTGNDGSTTFVDRSPVGRALSAVGQASILSNKLELDGVDDSVTSPDTTDTQLTGDFCIEHFGVEFDADTVIYSLSSKYDAFAPLSNNRGWDVSFRGSDTPKHLSFTISTLGTSGSTTLYTLADFAPATVTPYDITLDRSGDDLRVFVGGVWLSTTTVTEDSFDNASLFAIGSSNTASTSVNENEFNGRMTAYRFTAASRYGADSNYTVPRLPLPMR